MKALQLVAFGAISACASQPAYWHKTCARDSQFIVVGQLHDVSYEYGCPAQKMILTGDVITAPGAIPPAKAENTFYHGSGMLWINPESDEYLERSADLYPAVFPYSSLTECRAAGACHQEALK